MSPLRMKLLTMVLKILEVDFADQSVRDQKKAGSSGHSYLVKEIK